MKTTYYLSFVFFALLLSCSDSTPKEVAEFDDKMKKTIHIHDEVMPEMGKISKLINELEKDSTNTEQYLPAIENLKNGHDKMMTWMKSFGDEFSKTEINQGIQLKDVDSLKLRLKAIEKSYKEAEDMQKHVREAIKSAEAILK